MVQGLPDADGLVRISETQAIASFGQGPGHIMGRATSMVVVFVPLQGAPAVSAHPTKCK